MKVALFDEPTGLVTTTATAPTPAGLTAVNEVDEVTVTGVAVLPPMVTDVPGTKFVPVMVTLVPPTVGPVEGLTALIVGTA